MEFGGLEAAFLIFSSAVAVAINTITGGGSLITLPVLLALGIPLKQSVGVNMVALAIGGLGSVFGGMSSLQKASRESPLILIPTALGAALGATLLVLVPLAILKCIVPVLILVATLGLFIPQSRWQLSYSKLCVYPAIFLVAIYGGFFGAGMGVMIVFVLSIFDYGEIHVLNSLKNLQQVVINAIAAVVLLYDGLIWLEPTVLLAIGGLFGGYATGKYLEGISARRLRATMIAVGLFVSIVCSVNAYRSLVAS